MSTLQCSSQVSSVQHTGRQKSRNDRLVTRGTSALMLDERERAVSKGSSGKACGSIEEERRDRMHVEKASCAAAAALKG